MAEKPWDETGVDKKLEWLRAAIQHLITVGNSNNDSLNARERTTNQRLSAVEEAVSKILAEIPMDKHPSSL
jgi:hypothetical protein